MKLLCGPPGFLPTSQADLRIVLYDQSADPQVGSAGLAAVREVFRQGLAPAPRAWDFLSIALSVLAADLAGTRKESPDGWTREFTVEVAVSDEGFWITQVGTLEAALAFLTTDRWSLGIRPGGFVPPRPRKRKVVVPSNDCVVLLSGGLDSLVGAIDLAESGNRPFAVSQVVRGDAQKQVAFAEEIGGGIEHLQVNHNVQVPWQEESSQRARSIIFLAFGVLAATTLGSYRAGDSVPLNVCENGFIAINPPLTASRIGSLSTRTAHPAFLTRVQDVLDAAGLRVTIANRYEAKTKGEMLGECTNQRLLQEHAAQSTSCGRFQRYNYRHCGRCVPCQVRRAAFLRWGRRDATDYVYENLGKADTDHALFDDVRSVAMAIAAARANLDEWLGTALARTSHEERPALRSMISRGLGELKGLHRRYKVK